MQSDLTHLRDMFFDEADKHLAQLEEGILQLECEPDNRELIGLLFRSAHSVKGSSGMFGFSAISDSMHAVENLLDELRNGTRCVSKPLVGDLLSSIDQVKTLVLDAYAGREDSQPTAVPSEQESTTGSETHTRSNSVSDDAPMPTDLAASSELNNFMLSFQPSAGALRRGIEPLGLLDALQTLGRVTDVRIDCRAVDRLSEMDPTDCALKWTCCICTSASQVELEDYFIFSHEDCRLVVMPFTLDESAQPELSTQEVPHESPEVEPKTLAKKECTPGPKRSAATNNARADLPSVDRKTPAEASHNPLPPSSRSETISVQVDRIEEFINLVGEIVIANAMLTQAVSDLPSDSSPMLAQASQSLSRTIRNLQDRVLSVRMLPLTTVFRRFHRLVRDLSQELEKEITLELLGDETELDKQVIEAIVDPLAHLIRNCAAHGLESPADRARAGKQTTGRIRLHAWQASGAVYIEVSDDGRGLDEARIREKACELGWIDAEDQPTSKDLATFIFKPGFSTASQVTEFSGRGVGMDVVKKNIESLGGCVSIVSESGKGTSFVIKLPLTLAIVEGLSVVVGDQSYLLPLLSVVEFFVPQPGAIKCLNRNSELVMLRHEGLPLLRLNQIFNTPVPPKRDAESLVVIVEYEGRRLALLVDRVDGQRQVVMKNLNTNYRKVLGFSGATITGDGRVALVLDIAGLVRLTQHEVQPSLKSSLPTPNHEQEIDS